MEKLMYLFNFEFKRNFKAYFDIVTISCGIFLFNTVSNLIKYNNVVSKVLRGKDPTTLTKTVGSMSFENILNKDYMDIFVYGLCICVLYSIIIWRKDLSGRNKSIYTLATLPIGRGHIYLSKFLNILCLVYMYVTGFMVVTFLAYNILPMFMEGDVVSLGFRKDTIHILGQYLPYSVGQFVTFYVFLITCVISIMFTFILLKYYIKSNVKFLGILILAFIVYARLQNTLLYEFNTISLSTIIICISIICTIVCTLINKIIINRIDF